MQGDEAELYRTLSPRVLRTVRRQVQTSVENVEDACHFAWAAFLRHTDHIAHEKTLSWITTTAIHEAYKLINKQQRVASLEQALHAGIEPADRTTTARPVERAELVEQLHLVRRLPDRQRRIVLLQAAGLTHAEIAHATGDTERTIQRQLQRARHTLNSLTRTAPTATTQGLRIASLSTRGPEPPVRRLSTP
jgi:RNA polymerase sigma factor (sigma-70 family)